MIAGIYHGMPNADFTAIAKSYADQAYTAENAPAPELVGCVAVNEELAAVLQRLMDKYTFAGVKNSFTKLCYYYKTLGPNGN